MHAAQRVEQAPHHVRHRLVLSPRRYAYSGDHVGQWSQRRLAEEGLVHARGATEEFHDFTRGGVGGGEAALGVKEGGGGNEEEAAVEGEEASEGERGALANEGEEVDLGGNDGDEIESDLGMLLPFLEHLRSEAGGGVRTWEKGKRGGMREGKLVGVKWQNCSSKKAVVGSEGSCV